jgi:hypothetical protein
MKKTQKHYSGYFLFIMVLISHGLHAQSGHNEETRKLTGSYHVIQASSGIHLDITKGDVQSATISASDQNLRNKIKTVIKNDTLKIFFYYKNDPNWKGLVNSKESFKVRIYQTNLKAIHVAEGAEVNCNDNLITEQLDVSLSSGGILTANITCKKLVANVKDGSEMRLTGTAEEATYKLTNGSVAANQKLKTLDCNAVVYSASNLKIAVTRSLKVIGKNKARIHNSGHPLQVNKDLTDSSLN